MHRRTSRVVSSDKITQLQHNDPTLNEFEWNVRDGDGNEQSTLIAQALPRNFFVTGMNISGNRNPEKISTILTAMETNSAVSLLQLDGITINEQVQDALVSLLETNTTLTSLALYWAHIEGGLGYAISTALATNTTLVSLSMVGLQYQPGVLNGVEVMLGNAMSVNTTLTQLDISTNASMHSLNPINNILESNTSLESLDISNLSFIDYDVAECSTFIRAITNNINLTSLNLGRFETVNDWSEDEKLKLVDAIGANSSLIYLYLNNLNIDATVGRALAAALQTNTTLTELDLTDSVADISVLESLSTALDYNTTLCTLELQRAMSAAESRLLTDIRKKMQGREYFEPVSVKVAVIGMKRTRDADLHLLLL
jgi:hypothetical protein